MTQNVRPLATIGDAAPTLASLAAIHDDKKERKARKTMEESGSNDPEGPELARKCVDKYGTNEDVGRLVGLTGSAISAYARGVEPVRKAYAMAFRQILKEEEIHVADQIVALVTIKRGEQAELLEKAILGAGGKFTRLSFQVDQIKVAE